MVLWGGISTFLRGTRGATADVHLSWFNSGNHVALHNHFIRVRGCRCYASVFDAVRDLSDTVWLFTSVFCLRPRRRLNVSKTLVQPAVVLHVSVSLRLLFVSEPFIFFGLVMAP